MLSREWKESPLDVWERLTFVHYARADGGGSHVFAVMSREMEGVRVIIQAQGPSEREVLRDLRAQAEPAAAEALRLSVRAALEAPPLAP